MPGQRCTVDMCSNARTTTQKDSAMQHIMYHRFPLDEEQCKLWVNRTCRDGKWNAATSRICSIHFTSEDYERNLKAELLGLPARKILKKSAAPSLFLYEGTTVQEPAEPAITPAPENQQDLSKHIRLRSARTSAVQYALLVDNMVANPDLAAGHFASLHGKDQLAEFWSNLANILNNAGPPKTVVQWQKVWTTFKSNIRGKVAKMQSDRLQTGNASTKTTLTELEEKAFGVMGCAAVEGLYVSKVFPNDDRSLLVVKKEDIGDSISLVPQCKIEMEELVIESVPDSGGFGEAPVTSPSVPSTPPPRASTQRRRRRFRFRADQNDSNEVFQQFMQQQNDAMLKLAEAQTAATKMMGDMCKILMEEKIRDREERILEREERAREREERMREREERMREREDRMREREGDREERVIDRKERGQQHAQQMHLLIRLIRSRKK